VQRHGGVEIGLGAGPAHRSVNLLQPFDQKAAPWRLR
jgi:hypothetical protein